MLLRLIFFAAELILLYLLSRALTNHLYRLFFLIGRSRPAAVSWVTLIMFPGTVIHELSHLFTAEVLGVRTGRLTLAPDSLKEEEVKTGSVTIAKTGPFRRTLIGLAPFFTGLAAFVVLTYFLQRQCIPFFQQCNNITIVTIGILYLLFAISSSMFPSSEDLKEVPAVVVALGLLLAAAYLTGFRINLTGSALEITERFLSSLLQSTTLVLAINLVLLLTISLITRLTRKLIKIRT